MRVEISTKILIFLSQKMRFAVQEIRDSNDIIFSVPEDHPQKVSTIYADREVS
jgi:hypothetical protein